MIQLGSVRKILVTGSRFYPLVGVPAPYNEYKVSVAAHISQNFELRLEWEKVGSYFETKGSAQFYF